LVNSLFDFKIEKSKGAIIDSCSHGFPLVNSYLNFVCLGKRNKIKTSVKTNKNNLKFGSLLSLNLDKIFFIISFNINSENNYNLTKFAPY
jgi:hypothetical protein